MTDEMAPKFKIGDCVFVLQTCWGCVAAVCSCAHKPCVRGVVVGGPDIVDWFGSPGISGRYFMYAVEVEFGPSRKIMTFKDTLLRFDVERTLIRTVSAEELES